MTRSYLLKLYYTTQYFVKTMQYYERNHHRSFLSLAFFSLLAFTIPVPSPLSQDGAPNSSSILARISPFYVLFCSSTPFLSTNYKNYSFWSFSSISKIFGIQSSRLFRLGFIYSLLRRLFVTQTRSGHFLKFSYISLATFRYIDMSL